MFSFILFRFISDIITDIRLSPPETPRRCTSSSSCPVGLNKKRLVALCPLRLKSEAFEEADE
jgi:hypothetical protein